MESPILQEFKEETEIELNNSSDKRPNIVQLPKVNNFWTPVRISKINSVELVNHKYYAEEKIITIPSIIPRKTQKTINQKGLLESVDLKVIMALPKFYIRHLSFDEFISSLSYRVSNEYLPTNFNLTIQIISNAFNDQNTPNFFNAEESNDDDDEEELLFSIEIPLYRGLQSLGSLPLFDEVTSDKLVHFTVTFEGFYIIPSKPPPYTSIYWYVRLILSQYTDIQIVSTTTNSIDFNRILGVYSSAKDYFVNSLRYLTTNMMNVFSNCRAIAPAVHSIPPLTSSQSSQLPSAPLLLENGNNNIVVNQNINNAVDPALFQQYASPVYLNSPVIPNAPIQFMTPPTGAPQNFVYCAIPIPPNVNPNSITPQNINSILNPPQPSYV